MEVIVSQKQIKKISEVIEKKVKRLSERKIIGIGVSLLFISLLIYLFSTVTTAVGNISGIELVLEYHIITSIIFVVFILLTIFILLIPGFLDKFHFATLFTVVNIPLYVIIYLVEVRLKIQGFVDAIGFVDILSFLFLLFCLILFGIGASRRESGLGVFRLLSKVNGWIQKKYDEGKF